MRKTQTRSRSRQRNTKRRAHVKRWWRGHRLTEPRKKNQDKLFAQIKKIFFSKKNNIKKRKPKKRKMTNDVQVIAMEENVVLLSHSWENQSAHVIRSNGALRRCLIGQLTITDESEVAIWVQFREFLPEKKKVVWVQNTVCPLHLLYANDMWTRSQIYSESETEMDGCPNREYDVEQPFMSCLPPFNHANTSHLSKSQRRKLNWMTKQVTSFQQAFQKMKQGQD